MKKGQPFVTKYNSASLALENVEVFQERLIGDMADSFADKEEAQAQSDKLAYTVYATAVAKEPGEILQAITVIEPGDVSGECYMTKGHFHKDDSCSEIYMGMAGQGKVILQDGEDVQIYDITPGVAVYIPGNYGHRTVNVGAEKFAFMSFWPGNSEYDYERIDVEPFTKYIYSSKGNIEIR